MKTIQKNPLPSLALAVLATALTLAGCQHQEVREEAPPPAPAAAPAKPAAPTRPAKPAPPRSAAPAPTADAKTGFAACDAYLADYHRCHAALGMGSLEQIDQRYQDVRAGMLRRAAQDDATLGPSCEGLQRQMKEALAGRECLPPLPTPEEPED